MLKVSNIAFGGDDGMTAYVTLQDQKWVETFRVDRNGTKNLFLLSFWKLFGSLIEDLEDHGK